jgi:SPP1 gp7 family putative phage head morphogenesis protein
MRGVKQRDPRSLADPMPEMTAFSLRLVQDVEKVIDDLAALPAAKKMTEQAMAHGRKWANKSMRAVGVPIPDTPSPFLLPPEQRLVELSTQKTYSEIKGLTNDASKRLSRTLTEAYSKSENINQIAKRVKVATDFSRNKAITIARTESLRAGNEAAVARYEAHGIEQVEYVAALDDRVCEECESLHGNIYELGSEPDLPVHPNCRCTYVAVVERE